VFNTPTGSASRLPAWSKDRIVNRIIWIVGAVVIVLFILGYFGLR
jgi:small-conductance mechanosensitive channel